MRTWNLQSEVLTYIDQKQLLATPTRRAVVSIVGFSIGCVIGILVSAVVLFSFYVIM